MKSLRELSGWLRLADVERLDSPSAKKLVDSVLQELESEEGADVEELHDILLELRGLIDTKRLTAPDLESFLKDFESFLGPVESAGVNHVEVLREKMYNYADSLPEERWFAGNYAKLEGAVQAYLGGAEDSELQAVVEHCKSVLARSWENYSQTRVLENEVTAESVVGHQLLEEGLAEWQDSLSQIAEELEQGGGEFEEALALAESGTRLLLALNHLRETL